MEAKASCFDFMKEETSIEVPFFQRAYVWKEEEWAQLFEDLFDSYENKREHFLGSIVLKQLSTNAGEGSKRSLIDGQQRLTTFSIFIKSLYDQLDDDADKNDYISYFFHRPTKNKTAKILHSEIDRASFEKILRASSYEDLTPPPEF